MKGPLLLLLAFVLVSSAKDPYLNIFIIPHSHCDPGWLNTFEGYFRDQVNRILSGVTEQLLQDSTKKFVWAEISFFQLWYDQQSQETRDGVKTIVKNGQLEFVAGGWVQNDEANANFDIVIDQVSEGHDFLHRVFGVVPRVAWQIDPFGHSSLTPSLFARMGFEALVINRIHYGLKSQFKDSKSMEFLWTGSRSLGNASEILTHVLHTHYSAPQGYDWEEGSMHINPSNVGQRANDFVNLLKSRANAYRTNNLLVPFGDDFKFQNPGLQFSNMDQLIKEVNSRSEFGVKVKYGTVSEYFDSVTASASRDAVKFPSYNGDFFPYADNEDSYWTGYYTSRPVLKGHSRGTDSILRAAEGLYALGRTAATKDPELLDNVNWNSHFDGLRRGRRNAALVQHHDGITGTAKQFVANDYSARLDQARQASSRTITEMAELLLTDKETPSLTYDLRAFSFDGGDEVYAIVVHNPLGWVRRKYIKLIVTIPDVTVTSSDGIVLSVQVADIIDLATLKPTVSRHELYFLAEVPPLGLQTFFLSRAKDAASKPLPSEHFIYKKNFENQFSTVTTLEATTSIQIENEHLLVDFQGRTGLLEAVTNKDSNAQVSLKQELIDYRTSRSGAYLMRPDSQNTIYGELTPIKLIHIKGILVSQVCTYFYSSAGDQNFETAVCTKVFSTRGITSTPNILEVGGFLEVAYSILGRRNCETAARFNTDLNTQRSFFTDNGLEIRARRSEGTRTENQYYPNLSFAYIQDTQKDLQFTILSRQAMGTHSRDNGMLEHMLHRALSQDDGRGLGEPNNDQSRVEVMVYLVVQPPEPSVRMGRRLALALQHQPRVLHTKIEGGAKMWAAKYKPNYYPLTGQFPHNVHLLSLKARDSITDDVIIRFIHIYETGQHSTFSQPKEIVWDSIFKDFNIESKRERSLAMSMDVDVAQAKKPHYLSDGTLQHASGISPVFTQQESQNTQEEGVFISQAALDAKKKESEKSQDNPAGRKLKSLTLAPNDAIIVLEPMQIKSYFVQFVLKSDPPIEVIVTPGNSELDDGAIEPPKPPLAEVSEVEMRAFFIISILGTGLVILAYVRLRKRNSKVNTKRKGLMEV